MQVRYSNVGTTEPITEADVKSWLKVDFTDEDTLIASLITQVRELAEEASGLSLIGKTIEYFEEEPESGEWIKLPYPEHNEITSVNFNGELLTSDEYYTTGLTQKLIKITGSYHGFDDSGLKVTYTTKGTCPSGVKLAMLKSIGETYEKRGNTFEGSLVKLTDNFYNYLSQFKSY